MDRIIIEFYYIPLMLRFVNKPNLQYKIKQIGMDYFHTYPCIVAFDRLYYLCR